MRIYVSSRASIPERVKMWHTFRDTHPDVISTWIDEAGPGESNMAELWVRCIEEAKSADLMILYVELSDLPLKGAFWEGGATLAGGGSVAIVTPDAWGALGSFTAHPKVFRAKSIESAIELYKLKMKG